MKQLLAVAGAGSVLIAWAAWQPQAESSSSPVRDDTRALLVRFGVTDTETTVWDGEVSVTGGEIVRLSSWRPLPGEAIQGQRAWKLSSTWSDKFQNRPWEREPMTPNSPFLRKPGLIVEYRGAAPVLIFSTPHGQFAAGPRGGTFLNGRVGVDPVASAVRISAEDRENEHVALARGPGQDMWLAWVTWNGTGNEILVRRNDGREWSATEALTTKPTDVFRVQLGVGSKAGLWAIWSEQVNGNWDLYGRRRRGDAWDPTERLTEAPQPDIHHALASDSEGNLWLVWQGFRNGQ